MLFRSKEEKFGKLVDLLKSEFPIESYFIYCLEMMKSVDRGYFRDYLTIEIIRMGESEEFPSLQSIATEIAVSKIVEDSKDDLKTIC